MTIAGRTDSRTRSGLALLALGIVLLALCGLGAVLDPRACLAAWLTAWWFWAGPMLGAQATLWLQRLTGGAWIAPIAIPLDRLRAAIPVLVVLILPVLAWPGPLYPWARPGWVDTAGEPAFRAVWFSHAGMALRVLGCAALWSVLARLDGSGRSVARRAGYAAAGLLLYAFTISLAAIDLLMSLTPQWYSTAFGFVVLTAQLKAAMAAGAWKGARGSSDAARGDLGNLLLMYVMTWAYLAFTQFQIIWAENLPAEISWYLPRLQGPWQIMGIALAVAGFAVPTALLLSRPFKRSVTGLRAIAALLLAVSLCETAWWVLPSVAASVSASARPSGWHVAWMLALALAGMGLLARAATILFPTASPPVARREETAASASARRDAPVASADTATRRQSTAEGSGDTQVPQRRPREGKEHA
ncbi:hypothetical protein [Bordetella genomosp. 11]|uniref:Uncharacterized protein n=1 Tax=Bordetella genomosp. 11 TaxID=1416808 RepID=A0A261UFY4_9BORD|nr:hypothetical protein [Bordetella genomosp. 11]OZI60848.1 hypothetical protein CAL28_15855 [Bordetella genomosp. 11]